MSRSYRIPENITFESIDSNIYILNISNGEYYELSDSASIIWKYLDKGIDVNNIKANLKSLFIEDHSIESDVDKILIDFINLNLIIEN